MHWCRVVSINSTEFEGLALTHMEVEARRFPEKAAMDNGADKTKVTHCNTSPVGVRVGNRFCPCHMPSSALRVLRRRQTESYVMLWPLSSR